MTILAFCMPYHFAVEPSLSVFVYGSPQVFVDLTYVLSATTHFDSLFYWICAAASILQEQHVTIVGPGSSSGLSGGAESLLRQGEDMIFTANVFRFVNNAAVQHDNFDARRDVATSC